MCKLCGREFCIDCADEQRLSSVPCVEGREELGHDLVFLEVFKPGEEDKALRDLDHLPDLGPYVSTLPPGRDPIEISLADGPPTYSQLYQFLAAGLPVVVSGICPGGCGLTPEYFIRKHGDTNVTLTNTKTGAQRKVALRNFMAKFGSPDDPNNPEKLQAGLKLS
ncbi:unnamed protein product [Peniophora sp. CBMAI 1063]|nr:unnamed protein product [Peniophora sp. CBMAI 1063]